VVLAAGGYPGDYNTGDQIHGLPLEEVPDGKVFHAGTTMKDDLVVTNGGRVLCVTALGDNVAAAQKNAYALAQHISWDGSFCRRDIGYRAINRK
jgi:phosphoribosylamine--glycine ligase